MITVLTLSFARDKNVSQWLDDHNLEYCMHRVRRNTLTRNMLLHILKLSDNGFDDILIHRRNAALNKAYETLSMEKMIQYVISHPKVLKYPILYDNRHLLSGWHDKEVRQFIPSVQRQQQLRELLGTSYHPCATEMVSETNNVYHVSL